jgi:hypothetical protein
MEGWTMTRIMKTNFCPLRHATIWRLVCLLAVCRFLPLADAASESSFLRVAFFYNSSLFTDNGLRTNVANLLNESNDVILTTVSYQTPTEFRQRYYQYMQTNGSNCDLVLGPTESAALKFLNDSLTNRQATPFLAPLITTPLEEYPNINLTTASPSDQQRVRTAVEAFVNRVGARTVAILHTDDLWGRAMVKEFRSNLASPETIVHAQPVEEFKGDKYNPTNDYRTFISKMCEQGATLIGVALLTDRAANQFLDELAKFNRDKWVPYKPTLLLLRQPQFDNDNNNQGILYSHLQEFRIFYVADCLKANKAYDTQKVTLAPYLDTCEVIASAASAYTNTFVPEEGCTLPVHHILGFYEKEWETGKRDATYLRLMTGFHAERLGFTNQVMTVTRATVHDGQINHEAVASYCDQGPLASFLYKGGFFLQQHTALWNHWTLLMFVGVALLSFFHVIHLKSEKPAWIVVRTSSFWLLFTLNLLLTYSIWLLTISLGGLSDRNMVAALAIAAGCPTAASALGDITRRYLPMIDLSGIIKMLEQINNRLLQSIGKANLDVLTARLEQLGLDKLKGTFFDVLLLRLGSGDVRDRIREQFRKNFDHIQGDLEQMKKDLSAEQLHQEKEKAERNAYATSLLTALGYLSSSPRELSEKVEELVARGSLA